jgi:hypothetical protein
MFADELSYTFSYTSSFQGDHKIFGKTEDIS